MQDKDFDKIFNSKFEDFEPEPSAMVWENIAVQLDTKKGKRILTSYWSIAAGIAAVLTVGLLFLKDTKPAAQHHNYATLVHRDIQKTVNQAAVVQVTKQPASVIVDRAPAGKVAANSNSQLEKIALANKATEVVVVKNDAANNNNSQKANPQLIADVEPSINNEVKPVMPDVQLASKAIETTGIPAERPAVIASAEKQEAELAKKHGIHNMGGLINVLVSKIDKRQDKLIEFSDNDDDDAETSVTGVNLGVIKIKKQ